MRGLFALALVACATNVEVVPDAGEPIVLPDAAEHPDAAGPEPPEPRELRGVWITRFEYGSRAKLEAIIDRAAAANFNAVFVQIRGEGDAYYKSAYEPWAKLLTGTLGRDPGWDPLQIAIDRAHLHGMELHAYFNVFSAWSAATSVPAAEGPRQHALRAHPSWLAVESNGQSSDPEYRWFSPGNPAVRAHNTAVARDLLAHYAVDGLHLDRVRTPGPTYSRDSVTVAAFDQAKASDPSLTWGAFMRAQVSQQVADIHAAVVQVRPTARLSAAVWGIYQPLPGCNTSQGYADFHQDSRSWLATGIMDALVPMIYWPIEPGACTDWAQLVDGFVAHRAGRQIWAGMHALDHEAWSFDAIRARIDHARAAGAHGTIIYSAGELERVPARWTAFAGTAGMPGPYVDTASTP